MHGPEEGPQTPRGGPTAPAGQTSGTNHSPHHSDQSSPGAGEGTGPCFPERLTGGVASPHWTKGKGKRESQWHAANGWGSRHTGPWRPGGCSRAGPGDSRLSSSLCTQLSLRASQVKGKPSLEITEEDTRKPGGGEKRPLCGLLGAILCPNLVPPGERECLLWARDQPAGHWGPQAVWVRWGQPGRAHGSLRNLAGHSPAKARR